MPRSDEPTAAAPASERAAEPAQAETTHNADELLRFAATFSTDAGRVSPAAMAGALALEAQTDARRKKWTHAEAAAMLDRFLTREVN